jgi:membrane protease YdiL (CAAX protease family)
LIQIFLLAFLRDRIEILLVEGVIIIPALLFVRNKGFSFVKVFRLKPVSPNLVFISIIIGFSLLVPIDELDRIIRKILPMPEEFFDLERNFSDTLKASSGYNFFILFIAGAVMASVAEEMLFRGFLQGVLERSMEITRAVMITAVVFALLHLWPWQLVQILRLGVFLGVMSWKSGSIIPAVIVHFIVNSVSLFVINFELEAPGWFTWKGHISPPILILSLILVYYSFKLFYNFSVKHIDTEILEEG